MTAQTVARVETGEAAPGTVLAGAAAAAAVPAAPDNGPAAAAPSPRGSVPRALRRYLGTVAGAVILGVLLWRLGTGVFLDGLRRIDGPALLAGLGIGVLTTVFSAWRWCRVARALAIRLPFGAAVADYYRALFLNAALPGGVLGDVHRAVRHGQSAGDLGRGVRAVVLERTAGQLALVAVGVPVLLIMPSPVLGQARQLSGLLALAALGALTLVAAVRAVRGSRPPRRRREPGAVLAEVRTALLARGSWPAVLVSSLVVLAGHLLMFLVAARVAGSHASPVTLLPLALLALIAMGIPLNIGGWGPREGVTAWAFGVAGLGTDTGLTVAVVYGVLSLVASLPGILVLLARWSGRARGGGTERIPHTPRAPTRGSLPVRRVTSPTPRQRDLVPSPSDRGASPWGLSEATREKHASKESVSAASSRRPFSSVASEGRPMTPDSV
nr:lysylphosphatidylglycerol synthase transmembrane domain-containing protein [Streptomyces sp. SID2888]